MRRLPLAISVPHAGTRVPKEVQHCCALSPEQVLAAGDAEAEAIFLPLIRDSEVFATTKIARCIVDVGRAEDGSADGAIKTRTRWGEPVYREPLGEPLTHRLLQRYYRPFRDELDRRAERALLGLDCHTGPPVGPPSAPDAGIERPTVLLRVGVGFSRTWLRALEGALARHLGVEPVIGLGFASGRVCQVAPGQIPWVQLTLTERPWLSVAEKAAAVRAALHDFAQNLGRAGCF